MKRPGATHLSKSRSDNSSCKISNHISHREQATIDLDQSIDLLVSSLQENDIPIDPLCEEYFRNYLEYYQKDEAEMIFEIKAETDMQVVQDSGLNKRTKKRKREELAKGIVRAGILWSSGLDSTTLKERLTEAKERLKISKLYCFFFTKANSKRQSDREIEAKEEIELIQKYSAENQFSFIRIIEIDDVPPKRNMNLLKNKDRHSLASHNQWMVATAVKRAILENLYQHILLRR